MYCPEKPHPRTWLQRIRTSLLIATFAGALYACGGGGGGGAVGSTGGGVVTPPPASNAIPVTVDTGPSGGEVNLLYTNVTICTPGTSVCQTIDHVLLDTGSSGLRLLSSVLSPTLNLPAQNSAAGTPLVSCAQFIDGSFTWGPVVRADVLLGSNLASNLPVQIVADPSVRALSANCASGEEQATPQALGANGILGVGLTREDCGTGCTTLSSNGYYFRCTAADCKAVVATTATLAQQLQNPIFSFATDNNGLLIDLPAANPLGAPSLNGTMYLGLGTKTNNQVSGTRVFFTNSTGIFSTTLDGRTYTRSFIDTGSNGVYFDSATLARCSAANVSSDFYCPASTQDLLATLTATNGTFSSNAFSVGNAQSLFVNRANAVQPMLAGVVGSTRTFDWGLPFFFGKRVGFAFVGQTATQGTGPFFVY